MSKELTELGEWKVGQKVLLRFGNMGQESITSITRITDGRGGTIYLNDMAFNVNGSQRGGGVWDRSHISVGTEADVIRIRGKNARYRLSKVSWMELDPAKAIEIEKLLNDNGIVTRNEK